MKTMATLGASCVPWIVTASVPKGDAALEWMKSIAGSVKHTRSLINSLGNDGMLETPGKRAAPLDLPPYDGHGGGAAFHGIIAEPGASWRRQARWSAAGPRSRAPP